MTQDQRIIEDYLPIEAISAETKREKSIRQGHVPPLTCGGMNPTIVVKVAFCSYHTNDKERGGLI